MSNTVHTEVREAQLRELWRLSEAEEWVALERSGLALLSEDARLEEAMSLVAYSLWRQGRLQEAAELASRAVSLSPERYLSQFTAGAAFSGLAQHAKAQEFFRSLHDLAPQDKEAIRRLTVSTAAVDGLEAAGALYLDISRINGTPAEILIAPVRSVSDWAQSAGVPLLDAGETESIPFVAPRIWGSPASAETTFALSNKPYVAELTDVRIFGNSSLILTADSIALNDTGGDPRFGSAVSFEYEPMLIAQSGDRVLLSLADIPTTVIDAGIFLSGLASSYYGHWLPEFLPKLQFLQQHPDFATLPIIVDAGMPQSHFDHLSRLSDNPIIRLVAGESFVCRRLLVAPSPSFSPVELFPNNIPVETMPGLSMRAMRFLRGKEEIPPQVTRTRRIFLARSKMLWRRLINEDEIAAELAELGFETVFLEELTANEQVELFREAQWIVAPNGSALLNLVFADTSVKLLILTQPNLFNWGTFQGPMDALGYESMCVRGEFALSESQKHSDYLVPVAVVREALAGMGLSEASSTRTMPTSRG